MFYRKNKLNTQVANVIAKKDYLKSYELYMIYLNMINIFYSRIEKDYNIYIICVFFYIIYIFFL